MKLLDEKGDDRPRVAFESSASSSLLLSGGHGAKRPLPTLSVLVDNVVSAEEKRRKVEVRRRELEGAREEARRVLELHPVEGKGDECDAEKGEVKQPAHQTEPVETVTWERRSDFLNPPLLRGFLRDVEDSLQRRRQGVRSSKDGDQPMGEDMLALARKER
mmetsp:Transcript_30047/g.67383  ORF Transcript_30047/g.67383 Transcript_30047/m.67383 type:complete len:161 (-) Transcript_30047:250-732(-)